MRFESYLSSYFFSAPKLLAISINTNQGSYTEAELLSNSLQSFSEKYSCPIYTFAEDIAAGPGYFILSTGHKAFADDFSLIGGISANLNNLDLVEFAKQQGIKFNVESIGKFKVRSHPFVELSNENKTWVQGLLNERISIVKQQILNKRGNKIPRDKESEGLALGGEVFTVDNALKLGLVDGINSFSSVAGKSFDECVVRNLKLVKRKDEKFSMISSEYLENIAEGVNASMVCNRLSSKILS